MPQNDDDDVGRYGDDDFFDGIWRAVARTLQKRPAYPGFLISALIAVATLAWHLVSAFGMPQGELILRSSPSPTLPPVVIYATPGPPPPPVVINIAPAPPPPPVVIVTPPPVVFVMPQPPPPPSVVVVTPSPAQPVPPKYRANSSFRQGVYGGYELVRVDLSRKSLNVKLADHVSEVTVQMEDDVQIFEATDLKGDLRSLRTGQKLSMYLRKAEDNELVATAVFIERFR